MDDLIDEAPAGFVSFSDDGLIQTVNRTFLQMVGRDRDEIEGRPFAEIFAPGARVFYETHLSPLLKLRNRVDEVYVVCRTAQGGEVPALVYAVRRQREGVAVNDVVLVPIANRDRYEAAIRAARSQAEASLEAAHEIGRERERFIAILGHDLRVPLTAIALGAEDLVRNAGLEGEDQATAIGILASARRAARMVADLLDFTRARIGGGIAIVRRDCDLRTIAEKIAAEVGVSSQTHAITVASDGDCRGSWDPDRLAQVLSNLVRNAVQHGAADAAIRVTTIGSGDAVRVEVENAIDLEPDSAADLFSPFKRSSAGRSDGLGLGLYIVREIVRAHGGDVGAVASAGRFLATVVLPRSGSASAAASR